MNNEQVNIVETLISIFTIDKGIVKVLLMRKKTDPYKGYWILPGSFLTTYESLEDNINEVVCGKVGMPSMYIEQCAMFSDINRYPDSRVIACSYIGLIDIKTLEIKKEDLERTEVEWFSIENVPKLGYDHEEILENSIKCLRKKLLNVNIIKSLFPSDFTLPELQKVYEQILNKSLDRRNFRKKFINLDLIEETGEKSEGTNGRPAKYYNFKDNTNERELF